MALPIQIFKQKSIPEILMSSVLLATMHSDYGSCLRHLHTLQQPFHALSCLLKSSQKFQSSLANNAYDVIVVGGGHAGVEASAAAARMGARTLLVTHKKSTIGVMSCNPSFGGIGKGHLIREIDALDGVCARNCDLSGSHYKVLNRKKGPAVMGLRAQIDRDLYKSHLQKEMFSTPKLHIIESSVEDLILEEAAASDVTGNTGKSLKKTVGIILGDGSRMHGSSVVITTGTFLNGEIVIGLERRPAGRIGDAPAIGLAQTLAALDFRIGRLKTGTPPRIDIDTVDFSVLEVKPPDSKIIPFSFMNDSVWIKPEDQLMTWMTYTNDDVDNIVKANQHVNEHIKEEVIGPRYCPSLESKIIRFPKNRHQIWLEMEGFHSKVVYPNGMSCTLPEELQWKVVRSIKGLTNARVLQPGYGVQYDYVDPREVNPWLETKRIAGLFFAGQINGTTGYEEAASQGIIAGINAAAKAFGKPPLTVSRTEGYIGVLIDDLTTLGTNEPYRMFTSRSEFRLSLRPDNADLRLTEKGFQVGCVSTERFERLQRTKRNLSEGVELLKEVSRPMARWRQLLNLPESGTTQRRTAFEILSLPEVDAGMLINALPDDLAGLRDLSDVWERLRIVSVYERNLEREKDEVALIQRDEATRIPENIDYSSPALSISAEELQKLITVQPTSIAAASRIPGLCPSTLMRILHYVKKQVNEVSSANVLH